MSANPLIELSSVIPDSDEAPMQEPTLGPCIRYYRTPLDLGYELILGYRALSHLRPRL